MTIKILTIFSSILVLLAFTFDQCEATGLDNADVSIGNEYATVGVSPTTHSRTMIDVARKLDGQGVKHEESPYFVIRMPWCLLACLIVFFVTYPLFLFTIPFLRNDRWSRFKSVFWLANNQQYTRIGGSTKNNDASATFFADIFTPSIACGMIMATTLFLVIPEAIPLIQRGLISSIDEEIEIVTGTISRFGVAVMAGFLIHPMTTLFLTSSEDSSEPSSDSPSPSAPKTLEPTNEISSSEEKYDDDNEINETTTENSTDEPALQKFENSRYWIVIIAGDATNNIFDGLFIGSAYMTCSVTLAVFVTIITVFTELSRMNANYFHLTQIAGIKACPALLYTLFSGIAIFVGVTIIIATNPSRLVTGNILSVAAGVYFHISASECLPRIYSVLSVVTVSWHKLLAVLFFAIGALPVGLTLNQHGHCDE